MNAAAADVDGEDEIVLLEDEEDEEVIITDEEPGDDEPEGNVSLVNSDDDLVIQDDNDDDDVLGVFQEEDDDDELLIVDDEEKNHRLMTAILKNLSCDFQTARDGREAILKTASFAPDLIFLDIMLPEMDGFAVCRLLKGNPDTRTIPIIMVTVLDDKSSKLKALEAGANDFLTKPVDGTEVIFRTRNLLRIKQFEDFLKDHAIRLEAETAKKTAQPAKSPASTAAFPDALPTASSTRSNATALISTPAPKPMISPIVRRRTGRISAAVAPSTSEDAASSPQAKASSCEMTPTPCVRRMKMSFLLRSPSYSSTFLGNRSRKALTAS